MGSSLTASTDYFDKVAASLSSDGFTVQRDISANQYRFDIFAVKVIPMPRSPPYSYVVAVSQMAVGFPDTARDFSSFVMDYSIENRATLHEGRPQVSQYGVTTLVAIVSDSFNEQVKSWIEQTRPPHGIMKGRTEFPVLVELGTKQIHYYTKTPFNAGLLYRKLRHMSDKYLGFQ